MTDGVQQPAPRRLWPLWTVLVVVVLLLGCGCRRLLVVGVIRENGAGPRQPGRRLGGRRSATAVARGLADRMTAQLHGSPRPCSAATAPGSSPSPIPPRTVTCAAASPRYAS